MGKLRRLSPTPRQSVDRPAPRALQPPTFADLLKRHRIATGATQEELAERATLSVRAISYLEQGVYTRPQRETVRLLAEALDLPADARAAFEAAARARRSPRGGIAPVARTAVNLPSQTTSLIGRADAVAAAFALLRREDIRLLTVTGTGGVGKTRVALAVAATVADDFPDGVCFVPLAPLGDPALVAPTIAQALGIEERPGQALTGTLLAHLKHRRLLLVLDNFEQVAPAGLLVAALLAACPQLKVLVSSREALHVRGEHVYPLPPLALPAPQRVPDITMLAQVPAITLFVQRAESVQPNFALTAANAAAVADLCVRLDGLPLAIELAAAWMRLLPPRALLDRLEQLLPVLTGGSRDLPERQRTMRAAIRWSYELLDPAERTLFRRLAVFVGGCTLEATEAICGTRGDAPIPVLEGVASLLDKHLVQQAAGADEAPRFGMLETIREYGAGSLAASGEQEAMQRRHAAYYLGLAEIAEPQLVGPEQALWVTRLEAEHGNMRAALAWAWECSDMETGLRLAGALWRFWEMRGHLTEARRWLGELLALSADDGGIASAHARTKALNGAGVLAYRQGDYRHAVAVAEEALTSARLAGDKGNMAHALGTLGIVAHRRGEHQHAEACCEAGLLLAREVGDTQGVASVLTYLGIVAEYSGDYERAVALMEESLALRRQQGNPRYIGNMLYNISCIRRRQGQYEWAIALADESLAIFRDLGDPWGIGNALISLADIHQDRGDDVRARPLYTEGLAMFQAATNPLGVAECLQGLAWVHGSQGEVERAARLFGAAVALGESIDHTPIPADRAILARNVAAVRTELSAEAFTTAWEAGRAMPLERAIAEAT